jgi:hypothetical protein
MNEVCSSLSCLNDDTGVFQLSERLSEMERQSLAVIELTKDYFLHMFVMIKCKIKNRKKELQDDPVTIKGKELKKYFEACWETDLANEELPLTVFHKLMEALKFVGPRGIELAVYPHNIEIASSYLKANPRAKNSKFVSSAIRTAEKIRSPEKRNEMLELLYCNNIDATCGKKWLFESPAVNGRGYLYSLSRKILENGKVEYVEVRKGNYKHL